MSRLKPYISAILALFISIIVVTLSNDTKRVSDVTINSLLTASSTISVVPNLIPSSGVLSEPELPETTTTTRKAPAPKVGVPPVKVVEAVAPKTVASTTPASVPAPVPVSVPAQLPPSGNVPLDTVASLLRGTLVNILCYVPNGSSLHSISGSGIFIDAKGIILTNAHIAQYYLLADRDVSCTIRAGSPAINKYKAALIYISSAWIRANATILTQATPTGTGEYDFALLAVTKSATNDPLPSSFPSIALAQTPPYSDAPVVIASYGAQFLESSQIQSALYPTIVFGSIKDVYTFAVNTIDVLSLGGSAAAQEGSSGGGVADVSGLLVGTITTSTISGATDTRSLSAITASYIRAEYAREMKSSLDLLLSASTTVSIANFATQIPALESVITANLP